MVSGYRVIRSLRLDPEAMGCGFLPNAEADTGAGMPVEDVRRMVAAMRLGWGSWRQFMGIGFKVSESIQNPELL
ncbi:hypothetical protein GCM10028803_14660 [Larkinella knui]